MATKFPSANASNRNIPDGDFTGYCQTIHDMILANVAVYATPSPSLASFQTAIDNYSAALAAAGNGGKALTAAKNEARQDLSRILVRLSVYVNSIVKALTNDPVVAISTIELSGFPPSLQPTPNTGLPAPSFKTCQSMSLGTLYTLLLPVPRATGYIVHWRTSQVGVTPAGPIQSAFYTSRFFTLEALISGIAYDVRYAATGTSKTSISFTEWFTKVIL